MNIPLLRQIQEKIKAEPEHFDMFNFHSSCGTTHCIAGWAQVLTAKNFSCRDHVLAHDHAIAAIDLTKDEAQRLFYAHCWPPHLWKAYVAADVAKDSTAKAELACKRIDRFIKTEGRE